jgi:septum formation protein
VNPPGSGARVVLASASPRRAALLAQIGVSFVVRSTRIDESSRPGEPPGDYVERLAREKALAVAEPGQLTLGADTTVVVDDTMLGKPSHRQSAIDMLLRLGGRSHEVITGVAVTDARRTRSLRVTTTVTFREIDAEEAGAYWETGEPADKAGGYGIQGIGGIFAQSINGSYSAVVGLPLTETEALLREFGARTWRYRNV